MAAHLEASLKSCTGWPCRISTSILTGLICRLDRRQCVADGYLCGREVTCGGLGVRPVVASGSIAYTSRNGISRLTASSTAHSAASRPIVNRRCRRPPMAMTGCSPCSAPAFALEEVICSSMVLGLTRTRRRSVAAASVGRRLRCSALGRPESRTCGVAVCPISVERICRLAGTSVMWVSVHVASPAIVASSNTADSISPQRSMLSRVSSYVDNTTILEWSSETSEAPLRIVGHRKVAPDVDAIAFSRRDQGALRYTVAYLKSVCPAGRVRRDRASRRDEAIR